MTVLCRKCGEPVIGQAFGSDSNGWEHIMGCPKDKGGLVPEHEPTDEDWRDLIRQAHDAEPPVARVVTNVWLVWSGEWDQVLESIHQTEAGARQAAHELRKTFLNVNVEEHEVSQ